MKMKRQAGTLFLFSLCMMSSSAFALTAEWIRNTESDMKEYRMYLCDGASCTVQKTSAALAGTIPQVAVGAIPKWVIPTGKTGAIAVTAVDTSGNESPLSNVVFFDQIPPTTPMGLVTK